MVTMTLTMIPGGKQIDSTRHGADQTADHASFAANFQAHQIADSDVHALAASAEVQTENQVASQASSGEMVIPVQTPVISEEPKVATTHSVTVKMLPFVPLIPDQSSRSGNLPKSGATEKPNQVEVDESKPEPAEVRSGDAPESIAATIEMRVPDEALASQPTHLPAGRAQNISNVLPGKVRAEDSKAQSVTPTLGAKSGDRVKPGVDAAAKTTAARASSEIVVGSDQLAAGSSQVQVVFGPLADPKENVVVAKTDAGDVMKPVAVADSSKGAANKAPSGPAISTGGTVSPKELSAPALAGTRDDTNLPANGQSALHSAAPGKAEDQVNAGTTPVQALTVVAANVREVATQPGVVSQAAPTASHESAGPAVGAASTYASASASGADHVVLAATPARIEVGLVNGVHGWVKIRTEMGSDGQVNAALSAGSVSGLEMLRRELPALTGYLQGSQVAVNSVVVDRAPITTQSGELAGGGAGGGQPQEQTAQPVAESEGNRKPNEIAGDDWLNESTILPGSSVSPGLLEGSGSWLNVRV